MAKAKVFISYSSKDRADAEPIHKALAKHFDVWRDQTRLETDWSREIALALADADLVCLLWSESSSQSKCVKLKVNAEMTTDGAAKGLGIGARLAGHGASEASGGLGRKLNQVQMPTRSLKNHR